MKKILDITSLEKTLITLGEALEEHKKARTNALIRDACIQRFEYSYELSHKMLKRHLEATSANAAEIDKMTFQDLIRTGSERGLLLHGWKEWRHYRELRGATSHTYDESKANQVLEKIPEFYTEAQYLLGQLQKHNSDEG